MKSDFLLAFNQLCTDRGLPREIVLETLEAALEAAYRRNIDADPNQTITVKVDLGTGKARVFVSKLVVKKVSNPQEEITLAAAKKHDPEAELDHEVVIEDTPSDFGKILGRIAAQNAKQILLQRIREAERDARYDHYIQQEGEIVHGTVQSIKPQAVTLHLEGTEAILPRSQQVPGERYSLHQRIRAYVLEVRKTSRGPQIVVSRSHKNMLRRLLELEVPEIFNGAVEIKAISREAGSRSKVAVAARQAGVDPVGACVGMRGVRIQSIVNELGGEKIDVIEWSPDASAFIAKALSPAKVLSVQLEEDPGEGKTANVTVPDDQLSLAIGRAGQNARLAAKLTGWRIDIQGVTEAATNALQQVNEEPDILPALGPAAELLPTVAGILRQHEQEAFNYNSEELIAMRQVIEAVGNYYASLRNAERARRMQEEAARRAVIEAAESERQAAIDSALAHIPPEAYSIPLAEMEFSTRVLGHLEKAGLETAGSLLEQLAEGDEGLLKLEGVGPKSLAEIKERIEALDLPEPEPPPVEEEEEPEQVVEAGVAKDEAVEAEVDEGVEEAEPAEPPAAEGPPAVAADEVVDEAAPAVVEEAPAPEKAPEAAEAELPAPAIEPAGPIEEELPLEDLLESDEQKDLDQERRRRRELVFDEELGEVVAVRKRKRGEEDIEEWEEFL